jgi:imidazolonepropionase-like amidohydrolase
MSCGAPTTCAEAAPGRATGAGDYREAPRQADRQRHAGAGSAKPRPGRRVEVPKPGRSVVMGHNGPSAQQSLLDGPAIYGAGSVLSTTGGHGDIHEYPLALMTQYGQAGGEFRQCDGVDECVRAVREQLRKNAKVIKVCASGGVLSAVDDPIHQQFTVTELRAMVEVAGMADRIVAAHCHGKPGIMAALEAGVRTIEHGTYLDEEACQAMRELAAILVPTRTVVLELFESGGSRRV